MPCGRALCAKQGRGQVGGNGDGVGHALWAKRES